MSDPQSPAVCGGCSNNCSGSCKGSCNLTCTDACKGCGGACSHSCTGCSGTCKGTCKGTCSTGCTNDCVSACKSTCNKECKGNCYKTCNTSCYETCKGKCKGYCAEICQSYCQKEQVFSKNISPINNPSNSKGSFSWTNSVEKDKTINILYSDWNTLREYIQEATKFCGGTKPSKKNVVAEDPITAGQYNDLANGLNLTNVTANKTIITADIINILKDTYNSRKINNTLPAGEKNNDTGANKCCQKGMVCMASGQLLEHQEKTEKCKNQAVSACGGQSPGS